MSGSSAVNLTEPKKKELSEHFRDIAYLCVGRLPSKLHRASAKDLAYVASIAVDKMLLLERMPTRITRTVSGLDRDKTQKEDAHKLMM